MSERARRALREGWLVFDPVAYTAGLWQRLLPPTLTLVMERTPTPGGSAENSAHISADPHLHRCVIEYDDEQDEDDLRVALLHEVLHAAFRHVGGAVDALRGVSPITAAFVERALEEDTEALARTLVTDFAELGRASAPEPLKVAGGEES